MKNSILLIAALFISSVGLSQTKSKVYRAPDAKEQIKNHKSFAILPFDIKYEERKTKKKKLSQEEINQKVIELSYETQNAMYGYTLKKAGKRNLFVLPQNVDETNLILERNDIKIEDLKYYKAEELCEILGVDAVMGGSLTIKENLSQGAAAVLKVVDGYWATTKGLGQIKLVDSEGDLLFNYHKEIEVGLGEDASDIVSALMRKSANRFPYFTKNKNLLK